MGDILRRLRAPDPNWSEYDVGDLVADAADEIERLTRERDECRKLLRELVIAYHNNFHEQSSDKRMKLLPIMDRFIESARAAGGE